jgi:Helix-turn-helix domain
MLFSSRMVSEVVQPFWAAVQRGEFITGAAESVGSYRVQGRRWIVAAGGVRPRRGRDLQGRYLSFSEREEIAVARAAGESVRGIARRLGRSPSTVSASWRVTPIAAGSIARRRRTRWRGSGRVVPSRPSWSSTRGCVRSCSGTWSASTLPNRSRAACGWRLRMIRRCGCLPRRSISRCM